MLICLKLRRMTLALSPYVKRTYLVTFEAENARIFGDDTLLCLTVGDQRSLMFQSLLFLHKTPSHEVFVTQNLELCLEDLLLGHKGRSLRHEVLREVVVVYDLSLIHI